MLPSSSHSTSPVNVSSELAVSALPAPPAACSNYSAMRLRATSSSPSACANLSCSSRLAHEACSARSASVLAAAL
eukprot:CAMPEP_0195600542 /NCGR_PEP_ID=MMETSP0815-20121206/4608_1 /TAXON_ID=97485 /ORGANISM="Prymnesium parvum, Strain Texoma1" /LENGTH=74 /DNA_ID=CAMNT_0040740025 /DNA_START=318 /DNA_END=542 /DNA_ORIENTATION=-